MYATQILIKNEQEKRPVTSRFELRYMYSAHIHRLISNSIPCDLGKQFDELWSFAFQPWLDIIKRFQIVNMFPKFRWRCSVESLNLKMRIVSSCSIDDSNYCIWRPPDTTSIGQCGGRSKRDCLNLDMYE